MSDTSSVDNALVQLIAEKLAELDSSFSGLDRNRLYSLSSHVRFMYANQASDIISYLEDSGYVISRSD
jgi:hypothetical protein